jgi:hypothetical protein
MKAGEHIYIYLKHDSGLKFTHHGIYIGDDKVIHYWGDKVRKTTKSKFRCGKTIHIKKYKESYASSRVVKRAKKRLGEKNYNFVFNNCEHFAEWCKTGKHESKQVNEAHEKTAKYLYVKTLKEWKKTQQQIAKIPKQVKLKPPKIKLSRTKMPKILKLKPPKIKLPKIRFW